MVSLWWDQTTRPGEACSAMWKRNGLFLCLVLGAAATLWANLLPPRINSSPLPLPPRPQSQTEAPPIPALEDDEIVDRVNEAFRAEWSREVLIPAPPATDLAVLRRLTLALTGTIPSLEEIRRFEARPAGRRLETTLEDLLRDRRFADYFGERLARVFVGTEAGPFLLYRRHRFVAWLSDELMKNRPYDRLVRDLIAG